MIDPLLHIRHRIGLYSLSSSYQRIKKQQFQFKQKDQSQIDEQYDKIVYSNIGFDNIFTEYGDSSSLTRGKFSNNGKYFVTVGASGQGKVWDIGDEKSDSFGKQITQLKAVDKLCDVDIHPNINNIPAFAPNIITGTVIGQILVWTFDPNIKNQKCLKIKAHSDRVNNVKFHQTACVFISASYDKSWSIWDANKIKQLCNQKGHNKQIHTLSQHPDGSLILTGDLGGDGMVWDLRTGKGIYQISSNSSIVCSNFHPNGYQLCIGGKNNMINVFDLRRKKQLKAIPAHLKLVSDLTYTDNGAILLSSGHDNIVKTWHGRNYCSVGNQLQHPAKISSISYKDGKIGVTMLDKKWTIWSNKQGKIEQSLTHKIKQEPQYQNSS